MKIKEIKRPTMKPKGGFGRAWYAYAKKLEAKIERLEHQPQQKEDLMSADDFIKSMSPDDSIGVRHDMIKHKLFKHVVNYMERYALYRNQPQQKEGELLSELKDELISIDDRHYTWNDARPSVLRLINKLDQPQQKEDNLANSEGAV